MPTGPDVTPLEEVKLLAPPVLVPAPLAQIPGGEENLLPSGALYAPLRVEMQQWANSMPSPEHPETARLWWDGRVADSKTFTSHPISDAERYLEVPAQKLIEGVYSLYYEVESWNTSVPDRSIAINITIDKTPPVLAVVDSGKLSFPPEVVQSGITDHYLQTHNDELLAQIPLYQVDRPGDLIVWYWSHSATGTELEAGRRILALGDNQPIVLAFLGQMIRDEGDGQRFASYTIQDRAGNVSARALAAELQVDAQPIPRDLPWPSIDDASGSGAVMTLAPEEAYTGAVVVIPDTAVIYPGEKVSVQWGEAGEPGSFRAEAPMPSDPHRFAIPMESVSAHIGKELPVYYEVVEPSGTWKSEVRKLRILTMDPSHLPTIQCPDAQGQGVLHYSTVPDAGARLTLAKWRMISTDQCISIKITGVTAAGSATEYYVLDKHRVTAAEVIAGIGARADVRVAKAFLNTLKRNDKFSVKVFVTFGAGLTCPAPGTLPNFPLLTLTLFD